MKTKTEPYWNFWKVVWAGWLIRYPGNFVKGIFILLIALYIAVTSALNEIIPNERKDIPHIRKESVHIPQSQ